MKARSLWQNGGIPTPVSNTMGWECSFQYYGKHDGKCSQYSRYYNMGNVGNTMGNVANTMGNTANTVKQTIQANPHYSLFALKILLVIYGLIALYMNLITKKTGLKEYVAFIYLSFLLLLLGYSRYCTSKLTSQGGGMIFMIVLTSTQTTSRYLYGHQIGRRIDFLFIQSIDIQRVVRYSSRFL